MIEVIFNALCIAVIVFAIVLGVRLFLFESVKPCPPYEPALDKNMKYIKEIDLQRQIDGLGEHLEALSDALGYKEANRMSNLSKITYTKKKVK